MYEKIRTIKGVGEKKAELLSKLKINTIGDLLNYIPRTYEDRRVVTKIKELQSGTPSLIQGIVLNINKGGNYQRGKTVLKIKIGDSSGEIFAVFFNANYIAKSVQIGKEYFFFGRVKNGQLIFPDFAEKEMGILPVYPLTKGISQQELRKLMKVAIAQVGTIPENLPYDLVKSNNICSLDYAIKNLHFPENKEKLKQALYRIYFMELLIFQLGISLMKRQEYTKKRGKVALVEIGDFIKTIPFELTQAQKKVIDEISGDLEKSEPMNRLLQGDVGSGKTIVAEVAIYKVARSGMQSAFMVPTEVLAKQHFETLTNSLGKQGIKIELLTGSVTKKEKEEILAGLVNGNIDVVIGTHALIEDSVKFKNLGLVITDEQHRFGVLQRAVLGEKGGEELPNILVMTATPIPRTLGVVLYGDLDISIIDKMPNQRKPIITAKFPEGQREKAYSLMEEEIRKGRQAYVVAPLIEDSQFIEAKSAEDIYEEIKDQFKDISVGLLHGSMKEKEKSEIMKSFKEGKVQVLVSTVVIEVGINVPNATVMIIESSQRFGLSQLHQLRGRVGRGSHQSYCMLLYDKITETGQERLEVMVKSADGFYIAERDMEIRGVGDIFGTNQSGFEGNKILALAKNAKLLERSQQAVKEILREDPSLTKKENALIRKEVERFFGSTASFLEII